LLLKSASFFTYFSIRLIVLFNPIIIFENDCNRQKFLYMRKIILLLAVLLGFSIAAHAQTEAPEPPILLSLGVDVGTALSPTNNTYSSVAGISGKFEIPFQNPKAFFTISAEYSNYSTKSTPALDTMQSGHYIPLLIGFKYFITKNVYLEGDIGDSYNINSGYMGYQNAFTYSPIAGVSIPLTKPNTAVDIGLSYESRISGDGNINQAAIRVAYKFGL
jgi:hypothetical protein